MFAKILLFIKSMSLGAKIMSVAAFVVIVGSTTTAIVIVNISRSNDQTPAQQDSVAQNDQPTETGEQPKEEEKLEGDSENPQENEQNNDQTPTQEPTTDPVQPTPEPEKTCSELHNCNYNLNNRFVIYASTYNFWSLPAGVSSICDLDENGNYYVDVYPIVETKVFYEVGRFNGEELRGAGVPLANEDLVTASITAQVDSYSSARGYVAQIPEWSHCPGGGAGSYLKVWTWQEVIDKGLALDEAKCAQWGLSCGRW